MSIHSNKLWPRTIALDVGGSHVSASLFNAGSAGKECLRVVRKHIDAFEPANQIIHTIAQSIQEVAGNEKSSVIGIAFPGPFDYKTGVSAIANVGGKFEKMYGLHVKQALQDIFDADNTTIRFANDAHCFAIGAAHCYRLKQKASLFLTLGTGFGSAFIVDGQLQEEHPAFNGTGGFFHHSFLRGTADDYFSTRWFLHEYRQRTGTTLGSVKELATRTTDDSVEIFNDFGDNLGNFLVNHLKDHECEELILGGSISKSAHLFLPRLQEQLRLSKRDIDIIFCDDTEECILTGAALLAEQQHQEEMSLEANPEKRKATQPLLPLQPESDRPEGYDVFPYMASGKKIYQGFDSLANEISNEKTVVIDGYVGVLWEDFRAQLHKALKEKNISVYWYHIDACLRSAEEINENCRDNLNGDDPVFGKKYTGELPDFFNKAFLDLLQPDQAADLCIVYGTGAALSHWPGKLIYIDLPKNEIQYRMRAGSITNLGCKSAFASTQMYKRFYFVDWPVLNKHKEALLGQMDIICDEQRISSVTWMHGIDFQNSLLQILQSPFRARPWFEAGVWGGHWMKKNIKGLNENEVNYAWSFELITPENGIVLEGNGYLLEFSFDYLLYYNNEKLMGKAARRFGKEFPIRFDFLDTYVGANLSIQCHPRTQYIREHFGEQITQDETYYILDCEPDAKVYLGFQEDIDPVAFKSALFDAQDHGIKLPVETYVQKHDAHKHQLFLIPNATIHASGKNNLVLEISSTPYIFTFKMYDWLRFDLNGHPRPINIEHAFNNLDFERKGDYVSEKLISKPYLLEEWTNGRKMKLPTHEEHFYTIDRYEFKGKVKIETKGLFHICMLVEGESVEIIDDRGRVSVFSYAETFVIPAALKEYEMNYSGEDPAYVVVAYVKEECC
jgi:predicted NBD/HSP70 family sugar kinase/mannose-6-phosphate isomerase class I